MVVEMALMACYVLWYDVTEVQHDRLVASCTKPQLGQPKNGIADAYMFWNTLTVFTSFPCNAYLRQFPNHLCLFDTFPLGGGNTLVTFMRLWLLPDLTHCQLHGKE